MAITLRAEGYTYREIAERLGGNATFSAVRKLCLKFDDVKSVTDKRRTGRPRLSGPRDDRQLLRLSLSDRRKTARQLMGDWNVRASVRTVRRRLCKAGLNARIPRKKPFINLTQRKKRVQWAKAHVNWAQEQWNSVLWSDESKISLFGSDGIHYVRRRSGEEFLPQCLMPTTKHPVSIMVWGCMSANGVGRLAVCDGIINGVKYIEILRSKMLPSARSLFDVQPPTIPVFTFQQDNAPCHTAKRVKAWFHENGVDVMDWPGNSPDLNPIENLWHRLKILVAKEKPSNKIKLTEAVIKSWYHVITCDELEKLVHSMQRRCQAVIQSKGYATKY